MRKNATRRSLKDRLGSYAIFTLILGGVVELGLIAFLIYFWTGTGAEPDGRRASVFWRYLVLSNYATRTVTVCALILRTAVDLQALICTGLAAALLLEGRDGVPLADAAAISVLRAVNGGPSSLMKELAWGAPLRSIPAFLSLVMFLTCSAIQFSSTLLLSDFRSASIVADPSTGHAPVLQTLPDLIRPFGVQFGGDVGIWRQTLGSFPTFAETRIYEPLADDAAAAIADTGLIKRAFPPLSLQQRQTLRRYEGAAVTHTSRVSCVRPVLRGTIRGLQTVTDGSVQIAPALSEASIQGTVSWPSQTGQHAGLEGLACAEKTFCPPVPINCALPFISPAFFFASVLEQRPATLCLFNQTGRRSFGAGSMLFLVLNTTNTREDWLRVGRGTTNGTVTLPDADAKASAGEWSELHISENVTLTATVCLTNTSLGVENVLATTTTTSPGEQALTYQVENKTWNTDEIIKMVDTTADATYTDRGILSLSNATKISDTQLDNMYRAAGINYRPNDAPAPDIASQFLFALYDSVFDPLDNFINANSSKPGNRSVYMCSQCSRISGTYFDPHPYVVILFRSVLESTGHASSALHATLFWLMQAQYYGALPGFDFGIDSQLVFSQSVSVPGQSYLGLGVVVSVTVVNVFCVAVAVLLFLRRTRYSMYGNAWHAVAQVSASLDIRPLLERATLSTDNEVAAELREAGLERTSSGLVVDDSGRAVIARRGWRKMSRYGRVPHMQQQRG
ncbi:hypothetical protein B0H66DRAFT_471551 [Apodospora peruviana]|uniref:Uncharacterized protein n=1 Tax=Apodospora peruviana TaxID=516989 RepID=A0AAE0MDA4_9PEZI|nr:hypothetical protein B0H66DRAFT_471551 [Apodospora peruviana]